MKLSLEQVVQKLSQDLDVRPKPGCGLCSGTGIQNVSFNNEGALCTYCYTHRQLKYGFYLIQPPHYQSNVENQIDTEQLIVKFIVDTKMDFSTGFAVALISGAQHKAAAEKITDYEVAVRYLKHEIEILKSMSP